MKIQYTWPCPFCDLTFESRRKFLSHKKAMHKSMRISPKKIVVNANCQYCGKFYKYKNAFTLHELHCPNNPNRIKPAVHAYTDAERRHLSQRAKDGYATGKYHGWMNCHSSKMSYPEEFFAKIISNEFDDKNYIYNLLFFQYRLDFAWPNKKRCIEIDGSQHERNAAQKESDIRKDAKLADNGWKVLRIRWIDMYHNPKAYIKQAKHFIDDGEILTLLPYVNPAKHNKPQASKLKRHKPLASKPVKQKMPGQRRDRKKPINTNNYPLDRTGRPNALARPSDVWNTRLNQIMSSGIKLNEYGWVEKVHQATGLSRRLIYTTMRHFSDEMSGRYFRRTSCIKKC